MVKKKILLWTIVLTMALSVIPFSPLSQTAAAAPDITPLPIYKDESYSYAERAADLVARMTLPEKASQTAGFASSAIPRLGVAGYMWWNEAIHGYSQEGWMGFKADGASFPSSYSIGASWDPYLFYQEAVEIGSEIRERVKENKYNLSFFSPTVNLARDPRWGRNDESYGEDPFLVGLLGASFVKGVEGKDINGNYKIFNPVTGEGVKQAVTTLKHYTANNTEKNRYTSGADNASMRNMREYYTRPYRIVAKNADVSSVMMAYSSVAGVPVSFSSFYMDTLLRQTYGFSGYIVSDCDSVATSYNRNVHKTNPLTGKNYTLGEAFANAMANGLDLQCNAGETDGLGSYAANYKKMLKAKDGSKIKTDAGYFNEQQLEVTAHRLMLKRMQLGEFDTQNAYATEGKARYDAGLDSTSPNKYVNGAVGQTQERINLADELSRATIVLMKNNKNANNQPALPITAGEINADADTYKVGIIGPVGQSNFRGGYSSQLSNQQNLVTIEQAIRTAFADPATYDEATRGKLQVNYHYGYSSNVSRSSFTGLRADQISLGSVATDLDLAIVVVGQGSGDSREDGDRVNLNLASAQVELIKSVKSTLNPKKLVLVMETYGPIQMQSEIVDNADAILWSCFNGFRKGTGFGEAITGKNNPSGRTNATWLKDMINDIPGFYNYNLSPVDGNGGRTYMYNVEETIYPFGFGLSYSDIIYAKGAGRESILGSATQGGLKLGQEGDPITRDSVINVRYNIINTNNIAGKQIAEVYAVSPNPTNDPKIPKKRLVGFKKVYVPANGTAIVKIPVKVTDLAFYDEAADCYKLPTGTWQIWVSKSSEFGAGDMSESFEVVNGEIREDPEVVSVKPTQVGDNADVNGVTERVIFNLGSNDAQNTIYPNVAVTMTNEKLYGTRIVNNVPGQDIGVDPAQVEGPFDVPDTAKTSPRLDAGKTADQLPKIGEKFGLSQLIGSGYTITYASNRPSVVKIGDETTAGVFASGPIVMKNQGVATITVKVTAPSGISETTEFVAYVKGEAGLSGITVGGTPIPNFDGNTNRFHCTPPSDMPVSSPLLAVKGIPVDGATVTYSTTDDGSGTIGYAPDLTGDGVNPTAIFSNVYIKVSRPGHLDQVYWVAFEGAFKTTSFVEGIIDSSWSVLNEDATQYSVVKGYGLRLPTLSSNITGTNRTWKNVFVRPAAGDWTITAKIYFPARPSASTQQFNLLAWQDEDNFIRFGLQSNRNISFAPEIGSLTNGSISLGTGITSGTAPLVIYYKLQREESTFTGWFSLDGLNYTRVQSADGRRACEGMYLPDAKLGLFATKSSTTSAVIDTYCEYIDATSINGTVVKTDQQVLDDAFKAVVDYLKPMVPTKITKNLSLPVPYDYTIKIETNSAYISANGTLTGRPETVDETANLKVTLSHANAKIDDNSEVTVFDGQVTVKAISSDPKVDSITAPKALVNGYSASVVVKAAGQNLEGTKAQLLGKTATLDSSGKATISLSSEEIAAAGLGTKTINILNDADVIGSTTIDIVAKNENIWAVTPVNNGGKLDLVFAEPITAGKDFGVTINGTKAGSAIISADFLTIATSADYKSGDAVVISGVKYERLFPSYTFKFIVTLV